MLPPLGCLINLDFLRGIGLLGVSGVFFGDFCICPRSNSWPGPSWSLIIFGVLLRIGVWGIMLGLLLSNGVLGRA
jgi:hypothetical protein